MTFEVFLMGLLIVSVLTGLFTEAIKKWLQEREKDYYPNALAGYVSVVLSVAVGAAYIQSRMAVQEKHHYTLFHKGGR